MKALKKLLIYLIMLIIVLSLTVSCSKDKNALSDEEIKALKELVEQKDKEAEELKEELEKARGENRSGYIITNPGPDRNFRYSYIKR